PRDVKRSGLLGWRTDRRQCDQEKPASRCNTWIAVACSSDQSGKSSPVAGRSSGPLAAGYLCKVCDGADFQLRQIEAVINDGDGHVGGAARHSPSALRANGDWCVEG